MTVYVLCFILSSVCCIAANVLCPVGQCGNVTIYLGPRWGAKVIRYPQAEGTGQPQVIRPVYRTTTTTTTMPPTDDLDFRPPPAWRSNLRIRPITDQNHMMEDRRDYSEFTDGREPRVVWTKGGKKYIDGGYTTTPRALRTVSLYNDVRRRHITLDLDALIHYGFMNFTASELSGDELKAALSEVGSIQSGGDYTLLSRATHLYLGHNRISQLPSLVFPVQLEYSLQGLWLDNNPITYLSATTRFEISRLANLKVLSLANTGLRYFEDLYSHSLEVIDLSNNRLTHVPPNLMHLQSLTELYIDNNLINTLYNTPFTSLQNLRVLSLSGNYISQIWDSPFLSLYYLHKLRLNNNSLEEVDQVAVNAVTKISLGGNPMRCSCRLLDSMQGPWPDIADKDNLTCFIDDRESLTLVTNLQKEDLDCSTSWQRFMTSWNRVEGVILWLQRHDAPLVLMIVCALVASLAMSFAIRRRLRPLKAKSVPKDVTYNILDDDLLP